MLDKPTPSALENFVKGFKQEETEVPLSKEVVEQIVRELLLELPGHGWHPVSDVNELYRTQRGELIVRRESPQRLLDAVINKHDLELSFGADFGPKYFNSAIWTSHTPETMRWAMQEGFSKAGGMTVVEMIDPEVSQIQSEMIETSVPSIKMANGEVIDRLKYRATSGTVRPKDLRFILVATIAQRFPVEQMTQEEHHRFDEWQEEMKAYHEAKKDGHRLKLPDPFNIVRAFVPKKEAVAEDASEEILKKAA